MLGGDAVNAPRLAVDPTLAMLQRVTLDIAESVIRSRRIARRLADKRRTAERRAARFEKLAIRSLQTASLAILASVLS